MGNKRATKDSTPELVVYENPVCTTCRNLVMLLGERGIPFERINYILDPLPRAKLKELLEKSGGAIGDMVREKDAAKLGFESSSMSDDEVLDLLAAEPQLLQRPIVERGDRAIVARPPERVLEIL